MKTVTAFLVGLVSLAILYGIVHAVECDSVRGLPLRVPQLWEYPVILACILLLVPALTSAYWNEGIIQKLTGKR